MYHQDTNQDVFNMVHKHNSKSSSRATYLVNFSGKFNFLCLLGQVWIKDHLPLACPVWVFFRSLSSWSADIMGSYTVENSKVSSAKSVTVDSDLSGRSFMYVRKINGPKIEPCGTSSSTDEQFELWVLSTTLKKT